MKKTILLLSLILATITTFPCHIKEMGGCDGIQYFTTKDLHSNSEYVLISEGDTIMSFRTGSTVTPDSLISVAIEPNKDVHLVYRYLNSNDWTESWYVSKTSDKQFGCNVLPVRFSSVKTNKLKNDNYVTFTVEEEQGISLYNVKASSDGIHFNTIATVAPVGKGTYRTKLPSLSALLILPLILFVRSRKQLFALIIVCVIAFSCQKALQNPSEKTYKFLQIEAVYDDGGSTYSDVVRLF